MSGIYIPGMEMPKFGEKIIILTSSGYVEDVSGQVIDGVKAIPVPEHGDLIDYDFCMENYELLHDDDGNPVYAVKMRDINRAPTIIPAEEGE